MSEPTVLSSGKSDFSSSIFAFCRNLPRARLLDSSDGPQESDVLLFFKARASDWWSATHPTYKKMGLKKGVLTYVTHNFAKLAEQRSTIF